MRIGDTVRKVEQQISFHRTMYLLLLGASVYGMHHWWDFLRDDYLVLSFASIPVLVGVLGAWFTGRQKKRVIHLYKRAIPASMKLILQLKTVTFVQSSYNEFIGLSTNGDPRWTAFLAHTKDSEWDNEFEVPVLPPSWGYNVLMDYTHLCIQNEVALNALITKELPDNTDELPENFQHVMDRFPEPGILELEEVTATVYVSPSTHKVLLIDTQYGPLWNWLEEGDVVDM